MSTTCTFSSCRREPYPLSEMDAKTFLGFVETVRALLLFRDKATTLRIQSRLKENGFFMEADECEHENGRMPPHSKKILDLVIIISVKTSLLIEEAEALGVSADLSVPYRYIELLKATLSHRLPDLDFEMACGNCNLIPLHDMKSISDFRVDNVDDITAYFGPEVGYYFEFMQYYLTMLKYGAMIGTPFYFHGKFLDDPKTGPKPFAFLYSLFMIFWGAVLYVCWRRQTCVFR